MDGIPGIGAGNVEPGHSTAYDFDATPVRAAPLPLPLHAARRPHREGPLRRVRDRPQGGPPADADELVMVMNGFDTNFDRANEVYAVNTVAFAYMDQPVRVKRGELVRIYLVNVLEFDLVNSFHIHANFFDYYPTGTSPRAARLHRHGRPGPGRARHPRAALPVHRQVHVPRPRLGVRRAGLDGVLRGGGLMEAAATGAAPAARSGSRRSRRCSCSGSPSACSWRSTLPGSNAIGVPPEELAVERTVLRPGEIELHVRNDGPDPVRVGQVIVNDALLRVHADRRPSSAASTAAAVTSSTRGSRARPTRSCCSPRPAPRSPTRSTRPPRRPTPTSASTA